MRQYRIGEFSLITGITVKGLRHYQEEGLLMPSYIDEDSGYRYYSETAIESARAIRLLRELDFGLDDVRTILEAAKNDRDPTAIFRNRLLELRRKMAADRRLAKRLEMVLAKETGGSDAEAGLSEETRVARIEIPEMQILSHRFRGRYSEVGDVIGLLHRMAGRQACGSPFSLYYEAEHRENDADIEVCLPISGPLRKGDSSRVLTGGVALSCLHVGPYDTVGQGYRRLLDALAAQNEELELPLREVYVRGPGWLFRGNPAKYRTQLIGMIR